MSKALDNALVACRSFNTTISESHQKQLVDVAPSAAFAGLQSFTNQSANRERYGLFRGHVHSAINAIASRAAGQPVHLGRVEGATVEDDRHGMPRLKVHDLPRSIQQLCRKSPGTGVELITDGPLVDALDQPNNLQGRWQFVYMFVTNLLLTGRAFVVGQVTEGQVEFYAIPTSWVRPNADYTEFEIVNPRNQEVVNENQKLTRANVAFATLPNPSDPIAAMAPMQAQMRAVLIDEHIQTSQERFFENGIFPSVVVTVGADPHPAGGGPSFRPRLSGSQRRQVASAIRKTMSGVANYGNPAIIDGMIERIDRLSATQNEMGWDKSETKVRSRILSAFGVHPFILGEPVNVGGYAQAAVIEKQFCVGVNTYLDMLSGLMSGFFRPASQEQQEKLVVWWQPCEAEDPAIESQEWREARKNGDVTRNEVRHRLNLPPDETGGDRNRQFSSQDVQLIANLQKDVHGGTLDRQSAIENLLITMDLTRAEADKLFPEIEEDVEEIEADDELQEALGELRSAVELLKSTPEKLIEGIMRCPETDY